VQVNIANSFARQSFGVEEMQRLIVARPHDYCEKNPSASAGISQTALLAKAYFNAL